MGSKAAHDLWWKNAVIYCVDVELFADGHYHRATAGEPLDLERFGYRWLRLPG